MSMNDWKIANALENLTGNWVYYVCNTIAAFANIHFSRHVDNPGDDHMATNDNEYYYYGYTGIFSHRGGGAVPQAIRDALYQAWRNYFQV
ncbi:hypothetical protein [Nannocystis pusilla]|uniref:hypothetical protein n=1 Tax=Nannocystis pusilla TaxID=889268 RepID=UPI003BF4E3CA